MGDEHAGIERVSQAGDYVHEARAPRDHGVGDAGEAHHPGGDWGTGVEQRREAEMNGSRLEDRDRHLDDPATALGAYAGGFHVHDGEAGVLEGQRGGRQVRGHPAGAATSCSGDRRHPAPARSRPS